MVCYTHPELCNNHSTKNGRSMLIRFYFLFPLLGSLLFLSFASLPIEEPAPSPLFESNEIQTEKQSFVFFTPPPEWQVADSSKLPPCVKFMVVGKGPSFFPPSMNLSTEAYKGTLKQFLKKVRKADEEKGFIWTDLGTIRTEAGNASLSQVDMPSEWGERRTMQVILVKNGNIYILNASALKSEFSLFYKEFFAAMRSLKIVKDPLDMISSHQERLILKNAIQKLKEEWNCLLKEKNKNPSNDSLDSLKEEFFKSALFQEGAWQQFNELIGQKFGIMGKEWRSLLLNSVKTELLKTEV